MDSCGHNSKSSRPSRRGIESSKRHLAKFNERRRERRRLFRANRKIQTLELKAKIKQRELIKLPTVPAEREGPSLTEIPRVPPRRFKGRKGRVDISVNTATTTREETTPIKSMRAKRHQRINKETRHYNRIGHKSSEFAVAGWNCRVTTTTRNGRLYEVLAGALSDQIGFLGLVEHRDIFSDDTSGRITTLAEGWIWLSVSAERGPTGMANVGGIGALISPMFYQAYVSHKVISPRLLAVVFKRKVDNTQSPDIHRIHIVVNYSHTAMSANREATLAHYELLSSYVASIPKGDIIIILGDFNATVKTDSLLSSSQKAQGMRRRVLYSPKVEKQNENSAVFREFLEQNDLYPINTRFRQSHDNRYYTFYGPRGRRARLDYILVRGKWANGFRSVDVRPARNLGSDHQMVIARGKWRLCRQQKQKVEPRLDFTYLKDPAVAKTFLQSVEQNFDAQTEVVSLDDTFASFVAAYNGACAEVNIPYQTRRQRRVPWEDHEVSALRQARQVAKQQYRCNRSAAAKANLIEISNSIMLKYRERFEAHITAMCGSISANLASNRVDIAYKLLDEVCGGRSRRSQARIKGDSADDRLQSWFDHFSKVVFNSATGHTDMDSGEDPPVLVPILPADVEQLFNTSDFTVSEIESVVNTMSNGKATGIDCIPAEVYKIPGFLKIVVGMINAAFNKSDVPKAWRTLIVVPVPKKGDLTLPTNYRGISLMCIIAKIYNKAMLLRVRAILDRKLNGIQNGFRPKRSTISHIVTLREILRSCLSDRSMSVAVVFIDYVKAFDSVNWKQLRAILIAYRLPLKLVNGIMSLYRYATAQVRTADGLTDCINLSRGVLQGDTLAPYLFVIIMDYIIRKAEEDLGHEDVGFSFPREEPLPPSIGVAGGTRAAVKKAQARERVANISVVLGRPFLGTLFADDAALLAGGAQIMDVAVTRVQRHLSLVETKSSAVGLDINPPKTEALAVTNGKLVTRDSVVIRLLDGQKLSLVRDFKFLGSYLVSETSDIKKRLFSGWAAVRRLANFWQSSEVTINAKLNFFGTICQTIFLYPSPSWVLDSRLEALLNGSYTRMLRFVKGLDYANHPTIGDIYGDMPTVVALIAKRRLTMIGSVFRYEGTVKQPMTQVMRELAARRFDRRYWGTARPPRTFLDQLYEDLARIGEGSVDFETVVSYMKDPRKWKQMVETICDSYPQPAPLAVTARRRLSGSRIQADVVGEVASLADIGAQPATPKNKRPTPERQHRPTRKLARSLGSRRDSCFYPLSAIEYGIAGLGFNEEQESTDMIFMEVQQTRVPSSVGKGYIPTFDVGSSP